jgi:heat shock protein HslJ
MTSRIGVLAVAALLAACAAITEKEPPPKPFAGTRWDVMLELPLPGEQPWFRFGDGRMEGFAGCNRVTAQYLSDSVGAGAFAVRRIEGGTKACDAAARTVEARILSTMQSVSGYTISGDVMRMAGSGGTLTLRAYGADAMQHRGVTAAAASAVPSTLAGTRWIGVVEPGTNDANIPRLELVAEGRLAGYSGCNLLNGAWATQGGEARVGPLVTTKRACAGPEAAIEKRVLSALSEGRLVIEGTHLVAIGKGGERFEFTPTN